MSGALAFALLVAAVQAPVPSERAVVGRVFAADAAGQTPLPFALVELWAEGRRWAVAADSLGAYVMEGIPSGAHRLRAMHVGYRGEEVTIVIPGSGAVVLDLWLERSPVPLPPVEIEVDPTGPAEDSLPRAALADGPEAELRAMEFGTGMAQSGVGRAASAVGSGDPSDPSDVLFMRGTSADLKLVLLDGAPVFTPFHVGGLLATFDAAALGAADLYVGAAPTRYDGGLSYILDLRSRPARRDRPRFEGGADLLSARGTLELPLGDRAGVLVGGRALHGLGESMLGEGTSPYGYGEGLLRFDFDPAPGQRFSGTLFWNREDVRLSPVASLALALADPSRLPESASWGNRLATAAYRLEVGSTEVEARVSASRYDAELPLDSETPVLASGETERRRMALDLRRPSGDQGALRFGASFDRLAVGYQAVSLTTGAVGSGRARASGDVVGAYAELSKPVAADFRVTVGLRAEGFAGGVVRVAPRARLNWLLSEDAALTVAAGRYHQLTTLPEAEDAIAAEALNSASGGGTPALGGALDLTAPLLTVAGATHLLVGLDQRVTPHTRVGIDAFYKRFSGIRHDDIGVHSSGIDLRVRREGESLRGWVGYSLSWYWSPATSGGAFSGRQLLSAGVERALGVWGAFDVRVAYGDGLPFTAISSDVASSPGFDIERAEAENENTVELASGQAPLASPPGDFLRVDAGLHASFEREWFGRSVRLRPYVRVLNALNRRDSLFYYFRRWRDTSTQPLAELSLVPVVGLEWRF